MGETPQANGNGNGDRLTQREAIEAIRSSVDQLTGQMEALVGNPPADPTGGRIGRLEKQVTDGFAAIDRERKGWQTNRQSARALYISLSGVIVMLLVGAASVAVALSR